MNRTIDKINKNRQTVKAYSDKKISVDDWKQILDTIYWAPSSHGFEPYRAIIVKKNSPLRKKLQPMMWGQGVVVEADKLVFFVSLKRKAFTNKKWLYERALRKAKKISGKKGVEAENEAKKMVDTIINLHLGKDEAVGDDWAMKQAYIALGMSMSAATILGIGSTPMEGVEKSKVERLFRSQKIISSDERVAVVAAFGYPKDKKSYAHWGTGARVRDPKTKKFKTV